MEREEGGGEGFSGEQPFEFGAHWRQEGFYDLGIGQGWQLP